MARWIVKSKGGSFRRAIFNSNSQGGKPEKAIPSRLSPWEYVALPARYEFYNFLEAKDPPTDFSYHFDG